MKKLFRTVFRFTGALFLLIRNVAVLGMIIIAVAAVYFINMIGKVTVNQYNESLVWEKTAYDAPLAEVEPALVANVLSTDIVDAAAAWEDLEQYVDGLDGQSIPDRDVAEELLQQALYWQEIYHLKSNSVTRLSLYLDLEDAIADVYTTLDTAELKSLSSALYNLEMEEPTDAGKQYMDRLRKVSSDLEEVQKTMSDIIRSVGDVKDGVWIVPYTYTRTDLTEVLEQIQKMQKFPALSDTVNVLSDMADVLNYNKNTREYFQYQAFKEKMDRINRSQYVAVSSVYTYEQALLFGYDVDVEQWAGYTVSLKSPVTGIYYEGERLDNSQYIRKGARVTVEIDEMYDPIPEPEQPVTEIPMEGEVMEIYE